MKRHLLECDRCGQDYDPETSWLHCHECLKSPLDKAIDDIVAAAERLYERENDTPTEPRSDLD